MFFSNIIEDIFIYSPNINYVTTFLTKSLLYNDHEIRHCVACAIQVEIGFLVYYRQGNTIKKVGKLEREKKSI